MSVFSPQTVAPSSSPRFSWLREPLIHFLLLGALIFAIDAVATRRANDPHTIVVDAAVDQQAIDVFKAARGRDPNAEELYALRRVWLDNEVLYREGLALQVDKGDPAIRERVIFKALSVVDASVKLPPYTDESLRSWFEAHRDRYDEPARFDFQEAVLAGERVEAPARSLASTLNSGAPGDTGAGLRVFKNRPYANIVQSYGEEFALALQKAKPGEWMALPTREGWRVVRLEALAAPRPADYETLRGVVLQDWTDLTLAEQRSAAVKEMAKKYTVKVEAAKP